MSGQRPAPLAPAARALWWFWAVLLVVLAAGGGALQLLGPPRARTAAAPTAAVVVRTAAIGAVLAPSRPAVAAPALPTAVARATGAAIPGPDPALLEPAAESPSELLPRIGAHGRRPMQVYAAGFEAADRRPRIAIVLDGLGLNEAYSRQAVETLPAAVSLAFSPYAPEAVTRGLLEEARAHGHETLASIPLEPEGYPLNDPGPRALLTGRDPSVNRANLDWALSRVPGAVGATGAMDGLRGERLAASHADFTTLQGELDRRGLLYLDPRPGSPAPDAVPGRGVDVVLDTVPSAPAIDAQLARLEQVAHDRGAAVGLAGPLRPVLLERLAAWTSGLAARGFVLAPLSALARAPAVAKVAP